MEETIKLEAGQVYKSLEQGAEGYTYEITSIRDFAFLTYKVSKGDWSDDCDVRTSEFQKLIEQKKIELIPKELLEVGQIYESFNIVGYTYEITSIVNGMVSYTVTAHNYSNKCCVTYNAFCEYIHKKIFVLSPKEQIFKVETKYGPGTEVYFVVGSDDKAKVVCSTISVVNICAAISGVRVTYECIIDREEMGTVVAGSPLKYTVEKTEDKIFSTLQGCMDHIAAEALKKEQQAEAKKAKK